MEEVWVWTDGSCLKDGRGGWGAVLYQPEGKFYKEIYGCSKATTNNRMELMAAIQGLEAIKEPCRVLLTSDSQYVVRNMGKGHVFGWKEQGWRLNSGGPTINVDLWERLILQHRRHSVKYIWVKGHSGHQENETCDRLATEAAKWQLKM